ncbi:GVQW3 protein, partial [Acromyrmex heyeri]
MDQRICIKFCVKNKIKCADVFRMLTVAYGEATLDRSNVYRWYKMFSEGREDVNDEERAGRPSTSTTSNLPETPGFVEEQKLTFSKNDFLKCFEDWKKRWHKCIISDGDYFEGDKIHIHE